MSFIIFPLSARCLTHSKTKLLRGLKNQSKLLSCFYKSFVIYSTHLFWATSDHFFNTINWVVKSDSIKTVWKNKCPSSVVHNIAETGFLGHPAIDSCFSRSQHCHSTPLWGLRMWNLQHLARSGIPNQQMLQLAVTSALLSLCKCFSSFIIFY